MKIVCQNDFDIIIVHLDRASTKRHSNVLNTIKRMKKIHSAFILAAGEGTRLRPLTATIPKPLLPVFHKPLMTFAIDHSRTLGIANIALNTRYLHEAFQTYFQVQEKTPNLAIGEYEGNPISVFHEHMYLDTGGGLCNARALLSKGTFLIHNGDILTDAPLEELIDFHFRSGSLATLLLRHEGSKKNVTYNTNHGLIEGFNSISNSLAACPKMPSILIGYTGIAVIEPSFLDWIPTQGPASIIPALQKAIHAKKKISGFVAQHDYFWSDLGTPESYFKTHRRIIEEQWKPPFKLANKDLPWPISLHPLARVASSARLEEMVVAGPHALIDHHAYVKNCILLARAKTSPHGAYEATILGENFTCNLVS